jgi:hypothetical protein
MEAGDDRRQAARQRPGSAAANASVALLTERPTRFADLGSDLDQAIDRPLRFCTDPQRNPENRRGKYLEYVPSRGPPINSRPSKDPNRNGTSLSLFGPLVRLNCTPPHLTYA